MKVCVFGDSIGKGIVQDADSERYQTLKLDAMEPLAQYKNSVSLKNYSMFGCTVTKGLSLIERHEGELSGCDCVILEFGGNDCNFPWKEVAVAPEEEHHPKNPLENFMRLYRAAIEKVQKAGAKPILLTLPPLQAKRFFGWISKGLNAQSILKWLGGVDMIYRWQEMYSLAVSKLGEMLSVPVIDIRSAFLYRQDLPELIGADGMHPTSKGYELIVKTVCEELAS
ncbi:MAG: GDSL-type esterase/lipase family protein [Firmicutes bacterium]|nr:GDSL-type esterase/lipase family protein [Bacillota bacterium]